MDHVTEIFEWFDTVAEYSSDATAGMVPLSPEAVAEITAGDDDPRFATFIIESGWSKSKRFWGAELFNGVAEQINAGASGDPIVGYLGHIKPEDDPYTFPEIQMQWVKARVQRVGDKARLAVKAYVLPGTKARDYLGRRIANTVSWRGKALMQPFEKGVQVSSFDIESIDLSRPRKAGMSAKLVALTSEMEEGGNSVKPEEIGALQENELRAHNPALVTAIETAVKTPLETRVTEMTTEAEAVAPTLEIVPQLRKVLGLDDNVDDPTVLSKALASIKAAGKTIRDNLLESVLKKKNFSDPMLTRLIASEMKGREFTVTGDDDKDEATVEKLVGEIVDADEELKRLVSEMEGVPPALPNSADRDDEGNRGSSGNPKNWKAGHSTSNVRVRSVG